MPMENWTMRAPWPDEAMRLRRHFTGRPGRANAHEAWCRVIEAGDPERIVGLARLCQSRAVFAQGPGMPEVELVWEVRPAWREHPAAGALLAAAVTQARESGTRQLTTLLAPEETLASLALRRGFIEVSRQEIWRVSVTAALAQLEVRGTLLIERMPVSAAPLLQADLECVRRICVSANLLSPDRVAPAKPGVEGGFDPALSFFTGDPAHPAAVLLGREHLGRGYLEVLARNPEVKELPMSGVLVLMRAFFRAVAALGLDEVSCVVRPGTIPGIVPFMRRGGARRASAMATLGLEL